jgi:hypothetical protein
MAKQFLIKTTEVTRQMADRQICWSIVLLAVASLAVTGCGGGKRPTYPTEGKVVFPDGTLLTTGWVSFRAVGSETNVSARGMIQSDGTFELTTFTPGDGAVEGRHQAVVTALVSRNERRMPQHDPPPAPLIDPRFGSYDTSGLEFVVSTDANQNQFVIEVTRSK